MIFQETLLGMHVNPLAYIILVIAALLSAHAASIHQRSSGGSGLDVDDSPSGLVVIAVCLIVVAGLITSPGSAVRYEGALVQSAAEEKYQVLYVEDAAHSKLAHLVTAKPLIQVRVGESLIHVRQQVDPSTGEVTLRYKDGGELARRSLNSHR